jgi:hypothetical protein
MDHIPLIEEYWSIPLVMYCTSEYFTDRGLLEPSILLEYSGIIGLMEYSTRRGIVEQFIISGREEYC